MYPLGRSIDEVPSMHRSCWSNGISYLQYSMYFEDEKV